MAYVYDARQLRLCDGNPDLRLLADTGGLVSPLPPAYSGVLVPRNPSSQHFRVDLRRLALYPRLQRYPAAHRQ